MFWRFPRSVWSRLCTNVSRGSIRECSGCPCVHECDTLCLTRRLATPVPTVAPVWHNQPPVGDIARHMARLERAMPLVLPLRLCGVIARVQTMNEYTVIAPLHTQGVEEYMFRVNVLDITSESTHLPLNQEVAVCLTSYANGKWMASSISRLE